MDFEAWWKQHGNFFGDKVTIEMVNKYGIEGIKTLAQCAWQFALTYGREDNKNDHSPK